MRTRTCATLLIAAQLAGCTTLRPVDTPRPGAAFAVTPGDAVSITTSTGRRVEMDVERSSPEEICGKDECVRATEVAAIDRREVDTARSLWLLAGILLLLGLAGAAASSAALMSWGAPVFP